jgi:putative DNA primase/helicase
VTDEPDAKRYAKEAQGARAVTRIFELLKYSAELKKPAGEYDHHKDVINCDGVAVDLKTGGQRPASPEDFFTRSANYKPLENPKEARESCQAFLKFTYDILRGRGDLCEYLLTFLGYGLTAEMIEGVALFLLGLTGNNGKTTLINLLKTLLGDYIVEIPNSVIFKTNNEGRFDMAKLEGARLAVKSDIPLGSVINTGNFKNITGGDFELPAELKFHDACSFTPECKVIISCNNRPRLPEVGGAMDRRIALIPFEADFRQNPDKRLLDKLLGEAPAILALLIEYARRWYKNGGFPKSETIEAASREYMLDEDQVAQFIAEKCQIDSGSRVTREELHEAFVSWLGKPMSKKTLKERLVGKGFNLKKSGEEKTLNKMCFFGLRLLQEGELS